MPKNTEKSHASDQQGLVISYYGSTVSVETADGREIPCHLRRNQELPVVGDEIYFELEAGSVSGIVKGILPRRTVLARADNRGRMKPIAANIDVLVIVMSPPPVFSADLVDRYLAAAELLGIESVLVVNKSDLMLDSNEAFEAVLDIYRAIPYPVVLSSVKAKGGLDQLAALLAGRRGVLVGPSGVGKSSLIAALSSQDWIRIGEVSASGSGKHTTTASRLYHLDDGGALIDSPGVRDFQLWPLTKVEVLRGFREFQDYLSGCRFRDCVHAVEPGCAVQQAVADGRISAARYQSYQELLKQCIKPEDQYK